MSNFVNDTITSSIKISELIHIHPNGLRSIQVEKDIENSAIVESYILTAQSRACLARILLNLNDASYGRSWTLTGPFGSGKSFFSLQLMNLACSNQFAHQQAFNQLQKVDPVLSNQLYSLLNLRDSSGLIPVPITGFRGSFQECLKHGFLRAITHLGNSQDMAPLKAVLESWSNRTDSHAIVQWIDNFCSRITSHPFNFNGILIIKIFVII